MPAGPGPTDQLAAAVGTDVAMRRLGAGGAKGAFEATDIGLAAGGEAYICSFECTFCAAGAEAAHCHVCPNCGGELVRRPRARGHR